ncbi:MAG: hypothetical protein JW808_04665 [Victivallales bacterium]|nr:hypothetical protein [Victivallales bacterium]
MKKVLFLALPLTLLACGCRSFDTDYNITYNPEPFDRGDVVQGESLYIASIADERSSSEKIPFDQNDPFILIPLWPYTYAEVNPVITYSYFQTGLRESLSNLIPRDLVASGLFKEVHAANIGGNPPLQPDDNAYQLILCLKKACWRRYLTSYGLSYVGAYLWFILPKSYGSAVLTMHVKIKEPRTGKVIAEETFSYDEPTTEWIYDQMNYQPPVSAFALEKSFPRLMLSIRQMLHKALEKGGKK